MGYTAASDWGSEPHETRKLVFIRHAKHEVLEFHEVLLYVPRGLNLESVPEFLVRTKNHHEILFENWLTAPKKRFRESQETKSVIGLGTNLVNHVHTKCMEAVWVIRADAHVPGFFQSRPRVSETVGNLKRKSELLETHGRRGGQQGFSGAEIHLTLFVCVVNHKWLEPMSP